jgi:hypothetical protein
VPGTGDTALAQPANQPFVSPNTLPLAPVSQAASFSASQQTQNQRMNSYLLRHNQMARTAGRQGFVSFVPIVVTQASFDAEANQIKSDNKETDIETETAENK